MSSIPPSPEVTFIAVVHVLLLLETWIWYAFPYAASQLRRTRVTEHTADRSTVIHWGSLAAEDQRVPVFPSTARFAAVPAFSTEEALAGLPCDSREPEAVVVAVAVARGRVVGVAVAAAVGVA